MRTIGLAVLLLSVAFLVAQDNPTPNNQVETKNADGTVTVRGCVSRSNGDYTLMKADPAITYELQGSRKIKLSHYMGQRVEVTGSKSATLSSSSDATSKMGSAAPVTLTVTSIKTLDKDCSVRDVPR